MTILQSIKQAKIARDKVRAHCMAARVEETKDHVTVIFPPGYAVAGVRVTKAKGVVWACEQALVRMEREWKRDLIT